MKNFEHATKNINLIVYTSISAIVYTQKIYPKFTYHIVKYKQAVECKKLPQS
jgi:hypothetical protein